MTLWTVLSGLRGEVVVQQEAELLRLLSEYRKYQQIHWNLTSTANQSSPLEPGDTH